MGWGMTLRSILRPVVAQGSLAQLSFVSSKFSSSQAPLFRLCSIVGCSPSHASVAWIPPSARRELHSLTDARFPKRRPGFKSRRKRASLKPPGPYAWVQYVPGEPIPRSRPNEGSVQGRNRIKRIKLRKAFIVAEKKKRKAEMQGAKRKKRMERIERKMAAVARERAWAERLAELQKIEKEKTSMAA